MKMLAVSLLLLAAGCAGVPPAPSALAGDWGGVHVALRLGEAGGTLEYDCANGTIGPLAIASGGRFTATGTHTPEAGGPVREGQVFPRWRTTYSGTVLGERMTLEGDIETGVKLGPFELRRGAEPMLMKCL
jgi:hypothetical protein